MGRDKAFLVYEGSRLLDRQLATLRAVHPRELLVSGQRGTDYHVPGVNIVLDREPNQGPLGGIAALLDATRMSHLLVLAVDLPHLTAEFLAGLGRRIVPGGGVVPRGALGWEPLAAIYPREILPRIQTQLSGGERSICRMIDAAVAAGELVPHDIDPAQARLFTNWNRPEDLAGVAVQ
jgi:molybdopterin-guanine dinucleotide biosynthesis protein A